MTSIWKSINRKLWIHMSFSLKNVRMMRNFFCYTSILILPETQQTSFSQLFKKTDFSKSSCFLQYISVSRNLKKFRVFVEQFSIFDGMLCIFKFCDSFLGKDFILFAPGFLSLQWAVFESWNTFYNVMKPLLVIEVQQIINKR